MEDCACATCEYYASQKTYYTPAQSSFITIELANKGEQAMIVDSLDQCATVAHERAKVLEHSVPSQFANEYHPNRELAKGWDGRADALYDLARQVKSQ